MKKNSKIQNKNYSYCCGGSWFAWFLILFGLFYLAKELEWINPNISLWPILLIAWGISLVLKKKTC